MAGRSFWYRVNTGDEVPVHPSEDLCLPLFDKPSVFSLHEEILDEVRALHRDVADQTLISLVVRNGWSLVDAAHNGSFPKVVAPSEDTARIAIRKLQMLCNPSVIHVETLHKRLETGRKIVEIHRTDIQLFLEGTPLYAL